MDIGFLREESLFELENKEQGELERYIRVIVQNEHPFQSSQEKSLDKFLFLYDMWHFLELGKTYEQHLTKQQIVMKKIRTNLLDFFVYLKLHDATAKLNKYERFIFCFRFLSKIFEMSRRRVDLSLEAIREKYYAVLQDKQNTSNLEDEVINDYRIDWFKYSYPFTKMSEETLCEAPQIYEAIYDVCGLDLGSELDDVSLEHFIKCLLQTENILEISFWKKKFKELGLQRLFPRNNDVVSPTIVVCAQQNDYIRDFLNMQLGLICGISRISEKETRDFVYIPFSEEVGDELYCEKGIVSIEHYMQIAEQFIGGTGSINYRYLLNTAFMMLKLEVSSSGGEIIIICDEKIMDNIPMDPIWKGAVEKFKQEKGVRIIVFYMGLKDTDVSIWFADQIVFMEEFQLSLKGIASRLE